MTPVTALWPATSAQLAARSTGWVTGDSLDHDQLALLSLPIPIVHPWFLTEVQSLLGLSGTELDDMLYLEGGGGWLELHAQASEVDAAARLAELDDQQRAASDEATAKTLAVRRRIVERLVKAGLEPRALFLDALPIAPAWLRATPEDEPPSPSHPQALYTTAIAAARALEKATKRSAPQSVIDHRRVLLGEAVFDVLTMGLVRMALHAGFAEGDTLLLSKLTAVRRYAGEDAPPRGAPRNLDVWIERLVATVRYFRDCVDRADEGLAGARGALLLSAGLAIDGIDS